MWCNNETDSIGTWQGPWTFSERCHLYTSAAPIVSSSDYRNRHVPVKSRSDISHCFIATPVRARCGYEQMPFYAGCDISLHREFNVQVSKVGIETCRDSMSLLAIHVSNLKPSDFATWTHGYWDIWAEVQYTGWRCYSLHACRHDMSSRRHKHAPHKVEDFRKDGLLSAVLTLWLIKRAALPIEINIHYCQQQCLFHNDVTKNSL